MRVVHWFRNDLRLLDNRALSAAVADADEIVLLFVLDPRLFSAAAPAPARVRFLFDCVQRLANDLAARGSSLLVRSGEPARVIDDLLAETGAELLTFNRDYSPYACRRDERVRAVAARRGCAVRDYKDRVVFESGEIRTGEGKPYRVYSPYRRAWWARWNNEGSDSAAPLRLPTTVAGLGGEELPELVLPADGPERLPTGGEAAAARRLRSFVEGPLRDYATARDLPAVDGTSRMSPHLRFGTISVRRCIGAALEQAEIDPVWEKGARSWLDELVWREFYQALLAEEPRVLVESFRSETRDVVWDDDEVCFSAWCRGETGFPLVDAGMRQLLRTGWMHNRVRMITASFLVKDLLIDWRRGERHFFAHLVDGDPAANNGGWQWAASTGTDAQPYFRIFNPVRQGQRFDPDGEYVKRFVPELAHVPPRWIHNPWESPSPPAGYPAPIVDHAERREVALARFAAARRGRS